MNAKTAFVFIAAVTSATAWGCGSSSSSSGSGPTGTTRASLHRAQDCGGLLSDLKADASFKMNVVTDKQITAIQQCIAAYGDASCAFYGGYYGYGYATPGVAEDASGAPPATPTSGATSGSSASSYSTTNVQVKGVDEADIVKNDGQNIYVLHGNALETIKAWPADALAIASSIEIEGSPSEMFVEGGKAVVYSNVNGAPLYPAAGVTPKKQYQEIYYPMGGVSNGATDVPPTAAGPAAPDQPTPVDGAPAPPQQYVPLTKITVLDLSGAQPVVSSEVYFEGNFLDARRVDTHVRTVLQNYATGPALQYGLAYDNDTYPRTGTAMIAALNQLRAANLATIAASSLSDWLPYTFTKDAAGVHASSIACQDFYIPTTGTTEAGLTEVASIDLANPSAAPRQTGILGNAETVYANADTLYVAARAWVEPPIAWAAGVATVSGGGSGGGSAGGGTVASPPTKTAPAPAPDPGGLGAKAIRPLDTPIVASGNVTTFSGDATHIHKFEFTTDAAFPNYVASGTVTGSLKDQYSMDDLGGNLRVATSEYISYVDDAGQWVPPTPSDPSAPNAAPVRPSSVNHVIVFGQNGPWLDTVGDVGALAPNEQIDSVRFVETRGYVTTYRQVDPLFVIDLATPASPTVLGALTIPGFSEYMHPLDATHLLTIGRSGGNGVAGGSSLQLRIFDVTNGAAPQVVQQFTYDGSEWGSSDAEYDPKAFTYFDDKKLLAFPYYAYSQTDGTAKSTLELFSVDAAAGFTKLGALDASALVSAAPTGYCGGWYGPQVRRGVFLENVAYAITYAGIVAKDTTNLAAPGSSLALPPPTSDSSVGGYYGPVCVDGGVATKE